ncbi:MAG: CoA-transferase [Pseudomonadota bacterium]|jgi:glutaconate CoA-transferase subunit B|nr:acyl CoA--acetate/3-ketoacid CoA transferase subunit beta [Syntrophobacterales bacterium]MDI9556279.1 CoA-transferase [Pseudomonadota bacterium]NLX31072.1 acyl CoA--acetate/3-ketoacid CoA transferase subunit beta [Deltaproteobacteria bacterium]HOR32502.1 CoA-transferase [Syntrophales bacterium]
MALIDKIPDEPAKSGEFILPELMAIQIAHQVRNDDIVFAGTGLPMVGIMTANMLNAPNALLIYEAGICDGKTMHVPMSVCDQRAANMSSSLGGLVDTFGFFLQQGFVSLGFLGGAAIDKYGGVNVTSIGDYWSPAHRFTGSGGNSDIGTLSKRVAYIILQEKRRFLERNEYTTTPGWWCWDFKKNEWRPKKEVWKGTPYADSGPVAVVTNMGVYKFDDKGEIFLETFHPGVTVEQIKENCGFDLNVKNVKGETKPPTYRELFVLREFVDAELIFLPQKVEYPASIQKIING